MKLILLFCLAFAGAAHAIQQPFAAVTAKQFQLGNYWEWTYSERKTVSDSWEPYFFERYTVVATDGSKITLAMSSSPSLPIAPVAHHKMVVDFTYCEKAARDAHFRIFPLEFFTRSLGPDWQQVAAAGQNIVFTEKFSCSGALEYESLKYSVQHWNSVAEPTYQLDNKSDVERSWYFLSAPAVQGVAATKLFSPKDRYKFDLTSYCNAGAACLSVVK